MSGSCESSFWSRDILAFAQDLSARATALAMHWYRHHPDIEMKADASPVTVADRNVEAFLREQIAARYPDHGLLGEEYGSSHGDADVVWSIDPIDGTRSFVTGNPLWGNLLAVTVGGQAHVGVVTVPCTGDQWAGMAGQGSWLNGVRCRTRDVRDLAAAVLCTTSPYLLLGDERPAFEAVADKTHLTRFGGDCYSYGALASGTVDLVIEGDLKPYDYLPLVPVIEEAGGVITDWHGNALGLVPPARGRVVAAANAALHAQALTILSDVADV